MSIEEAPERDTPTPSDEDTRDVPWQKRYEDLRPEFDRTTAALKDEQAIWDDEQAAVARFQEKFPHLIAAPDEEDLDDEDFADDADTSQQPQPDPRVDTLVQWQAEQQYEKDLKGFVGDRELTEKGQQVVKALSREGGHNADALKRAVETWFALKDDFAPADEGDDEPEPAKKTRKPPHVVPGGKAASSVPDFGDMSRDEVDQWMVDRARALDSQTQ